jgi:hypothetical protein
MESEGSLPRQQNPATWPYPERDKSNPRGHTFLETNFNIILPTVSTSSKWSPLFGLKICMHFSILYTCPIHIYPFSFITLIVFGEE